MRGLFTLALGLSLAASSPARAQQPAPPPGQPAAATPDRAAEAKQRYETGMAHFQLEEWDPAIDEWQAGFRAKPVPQFLYNIAQAYRLSKRYDKALSYYQKYLRMDPKAPNKAEVDRHINQLTSLIEQEKRTQVAPPVMPMTVKSPKTEPGTPTTTTTEPGATTAPAPAVKPPAPAPAPAPAVVEVKKEPEKPTPITKKKWFWPVVGAGAAVIVAAVVIGVVVGTSSSDNTRVLPLARF